MSRDNDNLIIGDAKQSIYRFRNADPSLITSVVPDQFGASVRCLGNRQDENTNYRSQLRIVQFNNSFFEYLVSRLDREAMVGNWVRCRCLSGISVRAATGRRISLCLWGHARKGRI